MGSSGSVMEILGESVRRAMAGLTDRQDKLEEIRLRAGGPLAVKIGGESFFVSSEKRHGYVVKSPKNAYKVRVSDISEALSLISGYSVYAFEEEIKNGYITVAGGHRVGLCGRAVVENGDVRTLRSVSSLNIRVCHEIKGAADSVIGRVIKDGEVMHTLIVSPPGMGKTTILRDIVRQISDGVKALGFPGTDVAVVDERSEIAGTFMGVPQNDVGARTDVLDCCPKAKGMHMLLRSMSPSVVAADEIGRADDIAAIEEMLNAGIKLICTVHGEGLQDIMKKPGLSGLIEKNLFQTVIVLGGAKAGEIEKVYEMSTKNT